MSTQRVSRSTSGAGPARAYAWSCSWRCGGVSSWACSVSGNEIEVPDQPAEQAVNNGVKVALNQNQFDALVSFTFNVGVGAFTSSTLLKVLNQGQYDQVPTRKMTKQRQ